MAQFFDCALPEEGDGGEILAIESAEQNEEFKMDKDLGVFEFISKKDFSTVNQGADSAAAAGGAQNSNFDFGESKPGEGQSADQFFNFESAPADGGQDDKGSEAQPAAASNDLMDIFANVPSASTNNDAGATAGGNTNFNDIFAGSSEPLASGNQNSNEILNGFYTQQQQTPAQADPMAGASAVPMDN